MEDQVIVRLDKGSEFEIEIKITKLKVYNVTKDETDDVLIFGNQTRLECIDYIKGNYDKGSVFISKEAVNELFIVDTNHLYNLCTETSN
jgi:competence protein ComGF